MVSFVVATVLIFNMSGCAGDIKDNDDGKISIVTTIFPPYDFARQIISGIDEDVFELTMLISPGEEVHSYEPSPQDIIRISECDIFIYNGGPSDSWIESILGSVGNKDMKTVKMMSCVEGLDEEIVEGMQTEEHNHESKHDSTVSSELDEHVWTSPRNAMVIAEAIADKICETVCEKIGDAAEESVNKCRSNLEIYTAELEELSAELETVVGAAEQKTLIFGDRFPFRYLAHDYSLDYYAAFPGCSTDSEPSAATITFLINKVKNENIPVVFYIEFSNQKMADTICEETGAKKLLLHSCHNVTGKEFENGVKYSDLMRSNISAIAEALECYSAEETDK